MYLGLEDTWCHGFMMLLIALSIIVFGILLLGWFRVLRRLTADEEKVPPEKTERDRPWDRF